MANKYKKIILIALVFTLIMTTFNSVYAIIDTSKFNPGEPSSENNKIFSEMLSKVFNILIVIGVIVATLGSIILGIQAMTGSATEKTVFKEKLVPFIEGAAILTLSATIVSLIWRFLK